MGELEKSRLDELAEEINAEHNHFRKAFKATFRSALRAGALLNEAKEKAGHGQWSAWVEENCEFSMRTAQVYMRITNSEVYREPAPPVALEEALEQVGDDGALQRVYQRGYKRRE